jgi:hypothetical protein
MQAATMSLATMWATKTGVDDEEGEEGLTSGVGRHYRIDRAGRLGIYSQANGQE